MELTGDVYKELWFSSFITSQFLVSQLLDKLKHLDLKMIGFSIWTN